MASEAASAGLMFVYVVDTEALPVATILEQHPASVLGGIVYWFLALIATGPKSSTSTASQSFFPSLVRLVTAREVVFKPSNDRENLKR
jgi:hypothetical protein